MTTPIHPRRPAAVARRAMAVPGVRTALAVALALVAGLGSVIAVDSAWARANVISTDGYVRTVAEPSASDPQVLDDLATELTDQATRDIDLGQAFQSFAPPEAKDMARQLGEQVVSSWRQQLRPVIRRQLDEPSFKALWVDGNSRAHDQVVQAIQQGGLNLGVVTLDMRPVLVGAVRELGRALDREIHSPLNLITNAFSSMADALPASSGRVAVDFTKVSPSQQFIAEHADALVVIGALVTVVGLALALMLMRWRSVVLVAFGTVLVIGAIVGQSSVSGGADGAGAQMAERADPPISAAVQHVIDRQAQLIASSYVPWAVALAVAGAALLIAGLIMFGLRAASARRETVATA
jgi:hypothetical protein